MARLPYEKGISWAELAVVLLVYAIALAVLVNRLLYYQEVAEKTGVEYVAVVLKSALRVKMGELVIHNREAEIPALAAQNPVTWLERTPANYCGETETEPGPEMPLGCWYFVRSDQGMTYLVNSGGHFQPDSLGRKRIRYRLSVLQAGMVTPGVELRLVEPYRWLE